MHSAAAKAGVMSMTQTLAVEWARHRIVCRFDPETTQPYWALSYIFDFVLKGRDATPMELD